MGLSSRKSLSFKEMERVWKVMNRSPFRTVMVTIWRLKFKLAKWVVLQIYRQ